MKLKHDWLERAIKTFIQAFGGILIPAVCAALTGDLPGDLEGWKLLLFPLLCAALAAGISAVWNVILEYLKEEKNNE